MSDVFNYTRNEMPESVVSTERSTLTFAGGGSGNVGSYMIQNWNLNYQQGVQEIHELGSTNIYWLRTAPRGVGQLGSIVGENGGRSSRFLPASAFDACQGGANFTIAARGGFCTNTAGGGAGAGASAGAGSTGAGVRLAMRGVLVTSLGYNMSIQDTMIREGTGFRFATLEAD